MSNLENNTNDVNITTSIDGNAATGTAELSAELVNLTKQLQQLSQAAVKQANVTQSWNQAMGMSRAGVSQYSQQLNSSINVITKLSNATRIYKDVLNEAKKSTEGFVQAQSLINSNKGGLDTSFVQKYNAGLSQGQSHLSSMNSSSKDLEKAMKRVALIDISKNIQRGAQAEAQSAYTFTRNFSAPILAGLREAFFSYSKLATESNRTTKLILDNYAQLNQGQIGGIDLQMAEAVKFTERLGKSLDKITREWGTSRVLVQALAGDFAELGISSEVLLTNMTRLTVEAEKLGNLDIAQSSAFLQSMYQTILRIRRETGRSVNINDEVVSGDILEQLSGQLAVFNLIENKTVMSLKNIADGFPEVTAAATSFGLSMTEAMSMVIPMVGAGFRVGASANSMKVSLQRMVAMTKQNTAILKQLNQEMGGDFELSAGVGMTQIQNLSDAYGILIRSIEKGGKGKQGALELFSRLFGVRQGPRMESAFNQLNAFQVQLNTTGTAEQKVAKQLQDSVNVELKAIGQKEINIKKFEDLSILHRQAIASDEKGKLTVQAAAIQKGQIAAQAILEKAGAGQSDFISNMSTEVGKALMTQAFDVKSLAGKQYEAELKLTQNTPEVRYRRAKESMLEMGRAIVPIVDSILKVLLPAFQKLSSFLQNNPAIAKLTGAFLLLAASMGPIKLAFATMKTVFGGAIGLFVKLAEKVTGVSYAFASLQDLMSNPDLLRGQDKVVQYLDNFLIKTRRNGKALRKEMDLTGLSQPVQEMFKNNKAAAIYGTDKAVNMKRISPIVPDTSQFLNDMKTLNIENSTQMAAKVASGSEDGIAKGTAGLSDEITKTFTNAMHRFQGPNLFAGPNYFEGNVPGIGDSGGPIGRRGRGGSGAGAAAAAATGLTAADAAGIRADEAALNRRAKKQIADFFKNPLGIGNIAAGGPTPKNTDGLLDSVKTLLNTVKGQSSSSPPGGTGFDVKKMVAALKSYKFVYDTPGSINIGTTGTSGVLLSTLEKIKEGMPKPMSGRIVRDVSQSYGFPLTGQGRIPYPSTSVQEIFPRAAVTSADKLKRQMLFAPKQLMPAPPPVFNPAQLLANINNNRTALGRNPLGPVAMERYLSRATDNVKLSFAQIREWYVDAGMVITDQLDEVFSQGGVFTVSQSTFDSVKREIADPARKSFFKTGILDDRKKGFASITGFRNQGLSQTFRTEMAPVIATVSDSIEKQIDVGLNQTLAELTAFQKAKLVTSSRMGEQNNIVQRLLDGKKVELQQLRKAEEDLFINVLENGRVVVEEEFGGLNTHADDLERMKRDVRAKKASFRRSKAKGIQQIAFVPSGKSASAEDLAIKAADIAAMEADRPQPTIGAVSKALPKGKKGQPWDAAFIESQEKTQPELQKILDDLKKNVTDAKKPKQLEDALQELDQFLFTQERYAIAERISVAEGVRNRTASGDIGRVKKTISDLKKQKAAALRAHKQGVKSFSVGKNVIEIPTTSSELSLAEKAVREMEEQFDQDIAARRDAVRSVYQAERDNAEAIATEKMKGARTPGGQQRVERQGLKQINQLRAVRDLELKSIEEMSQVNKKIVSDARTVLDTSPARLQDQLDAAEAKLQEIMPSTELGNLERALIQERKDLNAKIKKAGFVPPIRPSHNILELEDRLAEITSNPVPEYGETSTAKRTVKKAAARKKTVPRILSDRRLRTVAPDTVGVPLPKGFIPTEVPQLDLTSDADYIRRQPVKRQRKLLKDFFAREALKAKFIEYPNLSAAGVNDGKGGAEIIRQFTQQLEDGLKGRVTDIGPDASAIARAMQDLSVVRPSGKAVGGASEGLREFFRSKIDLPKAEIELAMSNALTSVLSTVDSGTGAGVAGPRAKAGTLRSWKSFISSLSTGLAGTGKNAKGATTGVISPTQVFFGKLKRPKIDMTTVGGVQRAIEDTFISGLKGTYPSLESIEKAQEMAAAGKDLSARGLDLANERGGIKRRRATQGGKKENAVRTAANRGKGVKALVAGAVGDVNQELTDVRTQLAGSLQGLLDQKKVIIPDVAAVIEKAVIDPVVQVQKVIDDAVQTAVVSIPGAAAAPAIDNAIQDTLVLSEKQKANVKKAKDKLKGIKDSAAQSLGIKPASVSVDKITERIDKISAAIASNEKDLQDAVARNMPASSNSIKGPEKRIADFKKEMQKLERFKKQIIDEEAKILANSIPSTAPANISPTNATGRVKPPTGIPVSVPATPSPVVPGARVPTVGGSDGDGKIFNIDKIGHRFQGPNIFSKNIFDANLKDIIPNFDDLMAAPVAGATAVAVAGETAGVAITEGAAAMTAASAVIKQSAISKALFGNKALMGQFAEGQKKDVIESLFGKQMKKRNIIPEYVTNKLEDGTESTLLSSATRRRSLLPFGKIPIGLPIKQELADVDKLLTKGVLPNFTRLKKLLTGGLGKTWLFALSGGLSVLIGPLTKVLKNLGGLKQVLSGTATAFVGAKKGIAGIAAAAGQITSNVFGGIQKAATVGLNVFAKIAGAVLMIGTAFFIIVPIIGMLIALYGMFKSANGRLAGAATALKEAFKALVDGAKALFAPVRDLIFVFTGADKQMGGLTSEGQKNAAFFTIIANAIKKATTAFKEWAETIGAAFVKNTVVPQITRIINKFILLGSAIKDFMSGDKVSGMAKLKAMMLSFAYDIVNIVKIITVALINAFASAAPVIIQVMQGLLRILVEMTWAAMKAIGSGLGSEVGDSMIRAALGGMGEIGSLVLKLRDSMTVSDEAIVMGQSDQSKAVGDTPKQPTKAEKQAEGWAASLQQIIKDSAVGIDGAFNKILSDIDGRYAEALSSTNIKVGGINVPIVIDKKSDKGIIDQISYIAKKSAEAANAAGESLGSQIANGIKSKVAEIKDTLKGAFYTNVDEKFDDIVTQYTDALEKQKDQQLKAYDDQITAIDELAAAEERLTSAKEHEAKKREIIDKRQYDNENYSVERRLAVYEGRTFDVRRLDREELASKTDSDKSLTDLDSDRLKTLQSAQRDLAKQAIANQKDLAEEEFDVILKSFDTFMKGVKNKSFATQEEFAAALRGVADRALSSSLELGHAFEDGLNKLPAAIAAVRDPALAMFSASMGDLINEAAISFGINTKSKDPKSLLGAVGLMVSGVEQGFKDAFSTTFAPLYVKPAVDAIVLITSSLSKVGDPNNIADSWRKAGKDAFEALEAELNRTIAWEKIFKSFDDLFAGLKPKIDKVVALAVAAQNALANVGGQSAAPTLLDDATIADFQKVTYKAAQGYGQGKAYIPSLELGVMANRVVEFIGARISEGSAGILASGLSGNSGLSAVEKEILKLALPALNIAGNALNLKANPNAYRTDSEGRTGFMYGGQVGRYGIGGYLKAPASQGIPALLHGGEYIINHKAVEKFGKGNLERINNLKNGGDLRGFASGGYMTTPGFANGGYMTIPGFAKGGAVRRYGSADAMERASASPKFIGPPAPVVKKKGIFGKIGGFLSKSVTDVAQSFAKVGSGGLNIASALVESPLALINKRLSFNPITNLQKRNQDQIDNGINYIRGINKITGLNIAGGKTGGLGQIAGGKLTNFGDAFNVITSIPGLGSGLKIAPTIGKLAVGRMGLSATEMTLGQIMKPGVMAAMNNALTREAAALAGRGALQGFDSTILNPANIIDTTLAKPKIALPSLTNEDVAITLADDLGITVTRPRPNLLVDPFNSPKMFGSSSVFTHGEGGAFDKQILDLFDEMDAFGSGVTNKLPTITRREMLRAQLQVSGAIPKVMQSPEDLAFYNMMLDNLLGLGDNAKGVPGINPEDFDGAGDIISSIANAFRDAFSTKPTLDPRIIPQSLEVENFTDITRGLADQIDDLLRGFSGVMPGSAGKTRGLKDGLERMIDEDMNLLLPESLQQLRNIARYGPEGYNIYQPYHDIIASLSDRMALAPRALGMGTKGGALVPFNAEKNSVLTALESIRAGMKNPSALAIPEVKYLPKAGIGMPEPIGSTFLSNTAFENSLNNPVEAISEFIQGVMQNDMAYKWKGNFFRGFDPLNPLGTPSAGNVSTAFGFNTQLPRKAFTTLPKDTELIHANAYAIYDAAFGLGGLDRSLISELSPTTMSEQFVRDYMLVQSIAQQSAHEAQGRSILQAINNFKEYGQQPLDYIAENGLDIHTLDYEALLKNAFTPEQVDYISLESLRGQPKAKEIFDRLLNAGNAQMEAQKISAAARLAKYPVPAQHAGMTLKDIPFTRELNNVLPSFFDPATGTVRLRSPGALNDLFKGSATKDYEDGLIKTVTDQIAVYRDTIHVAPQQIAQDAFMARQVQSNAQYIIANMQDVLDANPGSLVNLYNHDSQFVTKPFQDLVIPNVKPITAPGFDLPRYGSELTEFGAGFDADYVAALRAKIAEMKSAIGGYGGYDLDPMMPEGFGLESFRSIANAKAFDYPVMADEKMEENFMDVLLKMLKYQQHIKSTLGIEDIFSAKPTNALNQVPEFDYFPNNNWLDLYKFNMNPYLNDPINYSPTAPYVWKNMKHLPANASLKNGTPAYQAQEIASNLRYELNNAMTYDWNATDKFLASGRFGFGGGTIKYGEAGFSETKNLVRLMMQAQGPFGLARLSEHNAEIMGGETHTVFAHLAHAINAESALHSSTWTANTSSIAQDGAESGILGIRDIRTALYNNLILRYPSTDNQFIQNYPGIFPGRFTRLTKIGQQGYEIPPPPDPDFGQIDDITGEFIGSGVKAPVSNKKAAAAAGFNFGGHVKMPKFKKGGYLNFKEGGEVPSILHGGEYVLNAGAVKKYGIAHIEAMNKMRFNVPQPGFSVPQSSFSGSLAGGMTTSTQNVNIYVDNFIGEPEWFNSMMKDYNTTVLPRNQKAAGLESRVISTYSGLNRGN